MIKKTIEYVDYNGAKRVEDFYFNLNKAELTEMELTTEGGMSSLIQSIVNTQDVPKLIEIFKKIIIKSYGVKSPDGKRFIKSQEITDSFVQTEAYAELFMLLVTNTEEAFTFINGIMPASLGEISKEDMDNLTDKLERGEPVEIPAIQPAVEEKVIQFQQPTQPMTE